MTRFPKLQAVIEHADEVRIENTTQFQEILGLFPTSELVIEPPKTRWKNWLEQGSQARSQQEVFEQFKEPILLVWLLLATDVPSGRIQEAIESITEFRVANEPIASRKKHAVCSRIRRHIGWSDFESALDVRLNPFSEQASGNRLREYANRPGQAQFRKDLIEYYGKCVFTGCTAKAALEAAHIEPYSIGGSDETKNGLLLRRDIHALFDANQIALNPETKKIEIKPYLQSDYLFLEAHRPMLEDGVFENPYFEIRWNEFQRSTH